MSRTLGHLNNTTIIRDIVKRISIIYPLLPFSTMIAFIKRATPLRHLLLTDNHCVTIEPTSLTLVDLLAIHVAYFERKRAACSDSLVQLAWKLIWRKSNWPRYTSKVLQRQNNIWSRMHICLIFWVSSNPVCYSGPTLHINPIAWSLRSMCIREAVKTSY